ncbi:MAG: hypothetical protein JNM37_11980 [Rhodocyclaceae bacterium]|nr:hypothetical protein [Rhodocyclaceae bacterium]
MEDILAAQINATQLGRIPYSGRIEKRNNHLAKMLNIAQHAGISTE